MEVPAQEVKKKKLLAKPAGLIAFNLADASAKKIDVSTPSAPVKQETVIPVKQVTPAPEVVKTETTTASTTEPAKKPLKLSKKLPGDTQTQKASEHTETPSQVAVSSNTEHVEHKKQEHSSSNGVHAHTHTDHSHKKNEPKEEQKEESKSVDSKPTVQQNNGLEQAAKSSSLAVKASFELISYFLDKDVAFEIQEDERIPFNKRLNFFLNRKYETSNKQDIQRGQYSKPQTKNGGQYNNQRGYNQQGNGKLGDAPSMARGDSKKLTNTPQLQKQQSSNSGMIKRGEEDQEVTQLKMKIKAQSAQFLEKMRSEKLDSFKKQISDIRMELNILTPTNFDIIKVKLFDLALKDSILCEYVVEGIIEKARTQKTYSVVYANLCKYIIDESKARYPKKEGQEEESNSKIFKNHLYQNIQETFEGEKDIYNNKMSFIKSKKLEDMTTDEERTQYYDDKKKRDMLNVKFIGNLFLNKSLNMAVMRICCGQLLSKFVEGYCKYEQKTDQIEEGLYENDLDALVALFEQAGQKMQERHAADKNKTDNSKLVSEFINDIEKKEHQKDIFENLNFDDYFTVFEWLQKNRKVSPRLYSLIVNLIERKNDNWKDRLSTQTGPVSLQNLHKQHEQDLKQSQQELARYEQEQKSGKGRNYKGNNNQRQNQYVLANSQKHKEQAQTNGKYNEKSGIVRAKEFWGYLDLKIKLQEDYTVSNAVNDFKQLREQCEPLVFGEILLKTVYDCNVIHKENRLLAACEATSLLKPNEFLKAFSERLNKSKDETSDFPLFLDFLSQLFLHVYRKGEIKFSGLQVAFKPEYDESDKEDVLFVYKNFFEECISILKIEKAPFDVAAFLKEEIDSVMTADDTYATFVKNMTK